MNQEYLSQLYLKDTAFQKLMQKRVYNVLLIASTYDAFIMEEDGRVEEQIYFEYVSLNLSSPPRVVRVGDYDRALEHLQRSNFDLIIAMPGVDISETFVRAREIKATYLDTPFVVLTPFSREVSRRLDREDLSAVDYVFSWLGNVDLLVAIIKLLEDKMNAPDDVSRVGVQMILLVEDSVRFYSSILPTLYRFILNQSQRFATEALNAHERMLRMRGRPKVMLARNYEEAVEIYNQYRDNMLGVISDVSFQKDGVKDKQAGIKLAHYLREQDPYLPIIVESSDSENRDAMAAFNGTFLDKNSKKLPVDLGRAIMDNFGFGDFVIRDPADGHPIMRLHDLQDLQKQIFHIPGTSLLYHAQRNDISRWLYSRALFPLAQVMKTHRIVNLEDAPRVRQLVFDLIVKYRTMKNRGVDAEFRKGRFDRYSNFARIGQGSLGGKGRGLAFIDAIIKRNPVCDNFEGVTIRIPHTVVLCTDIFDQFMEANSLYQVALSDAPDDDILQAFLAAELSSDIKEDLQAICDAMDGPLAVRSSSLLEDSHYQPFAGVYATYMIPRYDDRDRMVTLMENAVKAVYASVFFHDSKVYMTATSNVIDQEKMSVIIQEVVGQQRGDYFYPSFSGVGRSLNYYPVANERATDGIVEVAVGLGRHIVDGGRALRFSPAHPRRVLQTSTVQTALRDTQTTLEALDTRHELDALSTNEGFDIVQLPVQEAADQGHLRYMVSTFNARNGVIVDNDVDEGRKVVTFANVLKHGAFPLAQATSFMLSTGQEHMGRAVEIEFAGNIHINVNKRGEATRGELYWLQIRPMIDRKEMVDDRIMNAPHDSVLLKCYNALGHGMMTGIKSIVLARPEMFGIEHNRDTAAVLECINNEFTARGENYLLIGVGRWGSSDEALGIPVRWASISQARVIVELSWQGRRIDPSQGTHFFQNLTSMGVGYLSVGAKEDNSFIDLEFLSKFPSSNEDDVLVRVITLDNPLTVAINGVRGEALILK